jgi:lysophospholipase L1-like esterase
MRFLRHAAAALALLATLIVVAGATPDLRTSGRVLVLGDSITQDGRYVSFVEYYVRRAAPNAPLDLISLGLSSETASGLSEAAHPFPRPCVHERLARALKAVHPQLVIACYGMNDGIYAPASITQMNAFQDGIRRLIAAVHASGAELVLLTPPPFEADLVRAKLAAPDATEFSYLHPAANYDDVLAGFSRWLLTLHEPGLTVLDLHGAMLVATAEQKKREAAFTFTSDSIHPGELGHLLMARAIATALGPALPAAEPAVALARIRADALFALVDERRRLRAEAWLPFVGYERGGTFKSASVDAAERFAARLQTEIKLLASR